MIIRKVKSEELREFAEVMAIAFGYSFDSEKSSKEFADEILNSPASREDFYWQEKWAAFEDDDKTITSGFVAKPYPVHFDGHTTTMIGIGGVSTLPPYRRNGGIRRCFEKALPDIYDSGAVFSYLYPFSTAYYRKFGYEQCAECFLYRIKLDAIPKYSIEGSTLLSKPGRFLEEDIKSIYRAWQNRYNMMIVNEDFEFAWIEKQNPLKEAIYTYVYKGKDQTPLGYVTFSTVKEVNELNLICTRFFYINKEGLQGLLSLLKSFSDHNEVTFSLPKDQFFLPMIPEWSMGCGSYENRFLGMARVINVAQALKLARYRGNGSLIIEVTDPQISQNNHNFKVTFQDGTATQVDVATENADISFDIQDFTRFILGVCETRDMEMASSVVIHNESADIEKVFYKKPVYLAEYF